MQIGAHSFNSPVVLAPMAGVTDRVFRQLAHGFGTELSFAEMQASNPDLRDSKKSRLRLADASEPLPRAVQIVGHDPKTMADATRYNIAHGAGLIDINMGCPAKKVCKKAAGSALLGDPKLVAQILKTVVDAAKETPVSLKIRTGLAPDQRNGVEIAQIAEDAGIQALSVHGRTRACKFVGEVEYDTIAKIKQRVSIPVIANGDINSLTIARKVLAHTGADALMVGRASLGQPWWPAALARALVDKQTAIDIPDTTTRQQAAIRHFSGLIALYGEHHGVRISRKHLRWAFERFSADHAIDTARVKPWVSRFNRIESATEGLEVIDAFYAAFAAGQETQLSAPAILLAA